MTWHRRSLVGFDLEASGVDPETDRIVTAAVVRYGGGLPNQVRTWLSDADGADIPTEATRIHGVTTEAARSAGRPAGAVVAEIVATLGELIDRGLPLVVMNAPYDLTMLDAEAERHGVTPLSAWSPLVLDPLVLDKQVDRFRPGGRRLPDLCRHYVVPLRAAHTAAADAVAACAVTWKLANRHRWMTRLSLAELHDRQTSWAVEQQDGLRDHFARTPGKEHLTRGVRTGWPLAPRLRPEAVRAGV